MVTRDDILSSTYSSDVPFGVMLRLMMVFAPGYIHPGECKTLTSLYDKKIGIPTYKGFFMTNVVAIRFACCGHDIYR